MMSARRLQAKSPGEIRKPPKSNESSNTSLDHSFKLLESESALAFMDVGPIAKGREFKRSRSSDKVIDPNCCDRLPCHSQM